MSICGKGGTAINKTSILGIVGSVRKDSFNKALMQVALEVQPPDSSLEVFDLSGIPIFNDDSSASPPQVVVNFKKKIREADAILFVSPEYNYSISGVLKNAIDWASRPPGDNAWSGKPCAIMGASTGMMGTARAQYHLRQVCVYTNMHPINKPEVFVSRVNEKMRDGKLIDEKTRTNVAEMLKALVAWTKKLAAD